MTRMVWAPHHCHILFTTHSNTFYQQPMSYHRWTWFRVVVIDLEFDTDIDSDGSREHVRMQYRPDSRPTGYRIYQDSVDIPSIDRVIVLTGPERCDLE